MTARSPAERTWTLVRGALGTRAVAIVAGLGVADALANGPRPVAELARERGADRDALHRLLRALASEGMFAEHEPGVFANTAASVLLREGGGWPEFAHLFGGSFYRAAEALEADGEPAFPRTFGTDFWSWLAEHPDERALFDAAMQQGKERRLDRLDAVEWRGDETVVDVGGGNGTLLACLLRREPGLRGIVFDLPETTRDEASFNERCTFVEGSFFERVPTGDVYLLSTILHDWDNASAARILETIRACAPPRARVFLLEAVVPPGNEPHGAKWLDILMLTLSGGRERDEPQWRELLTSAGLEPVAVADGLVEARCP